MRAYCRMVRVKTLALHSAVCPLILFLILLELPPQSTAVDAQLPCGFALIAAAAVQRLKNPLIFGVVGISGCRQPLRLVGGKININILRRQSGSQFLCGDGVRGGMEHRDTFHDIPQFSDIAVEW